MDETTTKRLGDIDDVVTMSDEDRFLIIINKKEWLITKENLQKVFTGLTSNQLNALNKIIVDGSGTKFLTDDGTYTDNVSLFNSNQFKKNVSTNKIDLMGYHTHSNQDILDKLSLDENGELAYDGNIIGDYTLPTATTGAIGGVKIDGTTITIDEDGTIHGANTYELPTASTDTLGGVKIDGDTIKVNDGIISADVIGNWSAGVSYPVGYFAIYSDKLYECINANSDSEWTESNWKPIGGNKGTTINNWSASTDYAVDDLVINETTLYQCNTEHTSGETFDETEIANWTALTGVRGEKGNDGYSPTASVEQTETGCTITVTDENGTTTANLTNGKNGISPHIDETTKHWFIGEIDTGIVAEGVTTISSTSITYTGTLTVDGWVGDTAPYTQDVEMSGITADLSPFIDLIVSDDITTSDEEISQWSYITKATTSDNIITFRCNKTKPTIELSFKVKVV